MSTLLADEVESRLLGLLQSEFPLFPSPFAELGARLGISAVEVIQRVQALKSRGIVRQISPVLDGRKLGFQSTLVALKVPADKLNGAATALKNHPGVSHAYLREHEYNLWITLSAPPGADLAEELAKLAQAVGAEDIFDLPALKVFKLRAVFGTDSEESISPPGTNAISARVELSAADRAIINAVQTDLPLILNPFDGIARELGMTCADLLVGCRSLLRSGVIRRYGAAINHRRTGYQANLMACWAAEGEKAEILGQKLALLKAVSHCYIRRTNPHWDYNLFAMIHGHTAGECEAAVSQVSDETGLTRHILLYSTCELKKTRVYYRV
jgi:DNA-binding Lrp family transcriptional regulator